MRRQAEHARGEESPQHQLRAAAASLFLFIFLQCLALTVANGQVKLWEIAPHELLWHGRYKNCDHGYLVNLPPGLIAHGNLLPSPNHGILISAEKPSTVSEVSRDDRRIVGVYDSNDAEELGSPEAYLEEYELKPTKAQGQIAIIKKFEIVFRGSPAVYVHYRESGSNSITEFEELVVYRSPKEIGPLFNVVWLRTTPEYYPHDHALFVQIEGGLEFIPVPKGECSND